jgi:hypothetical protein
MKPWGCQARYIPYAPNLSIAHGFTLELWEASFGAVPVRVPDPRTTLQLLAVADGAGLP